MVVKIDGQKFEEKQDEAIMEEIEKISNEILEEL